MTMIETLQMMPRPGDRFFDGADVGWRRCRNGLGMGMPVTDKMQSPPVRFIDFSLFLAAAGEIQSIASGDLRRVGR
jgi:hypothetical protein